MKKRNIEENGHGVFDNTLYALKKAIKISPVSTIGSTISDIIGTLPEKLLSVIGTKFIVDMAGKPDCTKAIVIAVILIAVVMIASEILSTVFDNYFVEKERITRTAKLRKMIYGHAKKIDLANYDNTDFYSGFILSLDNSDVIFGLSDTVKRLLQNFVTGITISSFIATIDPGALVIIIASALISVPINRKLGNFAVEERLGFAEFRRKIGYYSRLFRMKEYAGEMKMNSVSDIILKKYDTASGEYLDFYGRMTAKRFFLFYLNNTLPSVIGTTVILTLYTGYRTLVTKTMTPGGFLASYTAAGQISLCISGIASFGISSILGQTKTLNHVRQFLETEPTIKDGPHTAECGKPETIRLESVSFSYEKNDRKVLDGLSLEISPCEKLAIVGFNGAGKTTLTNLLLRLYDVDEGEIKIGGRNIKDETVASHRDRFACAFQDFQIFAASIAENVAMSTEYDEERIWAALKAATFDKELPNGLDTILTKEFDENGINLSGGEQQKIVVARVFYKQCPYIILDEPSANLDPVAEYELNRTIDNAVDNKTVIFISHRLSTTRHADRIVMMEHGKIIELGTHDELMALNGKYAELFNMQAEKYLAE